MKNTTKKNKTRPNGLVDQKESEVTGMGIKVYDKTTGSYIGSLFIDRKDISKYEKDFIVVTY